MSMPSPDALHYDPGAAGFLRQPYETYRQLRETAPLYLMPDHDAWALSRFEDVFRAARDTNTFSSAQGLTFEPDEIAKLGLKPTIVMMDPPGHTAFRRLVSRGFTPRRVAEIEPEVRAFVVDRINRLLDGEGDFIATLAGPLPSFVVAHYLGVPPEDRHHFDDWTDAIVSANASGSMLGDALGAVTELYEYFTALVERRRNEPGDDMVTDLLAADLNGEPVGVEEILGYAFVMVAGGNDTTTGLLGGSAELLTDNRDQRRRLLDDPALIGGAVDELLRLTSPVQGLSRTTTTEVTLHGETLPAGSKVHLLYASANRDDREFGPTADHLDVTREIPRFMTFGSGPHFCLGAAAARLQGRVAIEELLARAPDFSVDAPAGRIADGPFVRRFEYLPFTASS